MGASAVTLLMVEAILAATALPQTAAISPHLQQMLDARDYAGAESLITAELSRSPNWEAGHLLLAQLYSQTGRYDFAERSALCAIHLRESLDGFMLLAVATMRLGRLNDSIGWLEKAARRSPDHAEIYRVLGLDYALGGALRESESAFGKAAALQPDNWENHYYRGRALFELGGFPEAQDSLQRAVQINTASVKAWTALGQVKERLGDDNAAEKSYRKALAMCGTGRECAWPLLQLGFLYRMRNMPRDALRFFRQAVQARSDWARPHFHLGKTLAEAGELGEACSELEQAVKLDQSRPEYHYQLAQVYRGLGQAQKATAQIESFRALADLESHAEPAAEFAQP